MENETSTRKDQTAQIEQGTKEESLTIKTLPSDAMPRKWQA